MKGSGKMAKTDFNKLKKKYKPVMDKTAEQVGKAIKVAEKDIIKMYKIAQTHVELQMRNLQKEKLYYELGKYVAGKIKKEENGDPALEKFRKQLIDIDAEGVKIKEKREKISKIGRKKTSKKK